MNTIPQTGKWKDISSILNDNFAKLGIKLQYLSEISLYSKGRFLSASALTEAYPTAMDGSFAYIGSSSPYSIYLYSKTTGWFDSEEKGVPNEFDWNELPTASVETAGIMSPTQVLHLEETHEKLGKYAPTSIVVMPEAELKAMAEAGTLTDGVLYLGLETEE